MQKNFYNYVYSADFETNNDNGEVYSWSAAYKRPFYDVKERKDNQQSSFKEGLHHLKSGLNLEFNSILGVNIQSFIYWLEGLRNGSYVYFHNGGNFDFWALFIGFFDNGYNLIQDFEETYKSDIEFWYDRLEKLVNNISNKQHKQALINVISDQYTEKQYKQVKHLWENTLLFKEFSMVLKNNSIYQMKLSNLELRDSAKLFAMPLAAMGLTLNSNHKTSFFKKIEGFDYEDIRHYTTVEDLIKDNGTLEYQVKDTDILLQALLDFTVPFVEALGQPALTASGTAYAIWTKITVETFIKNNEIKQIETRVKNKVYYVYKWDEETYSYNEIKTAALEPYNWNKDYDIELRKYYQGGFVNVHEEQRGIINQWVIDLDITSSYPTIMSSKRLLPIGAPTRNKPKGKFVSLITFVVKETVLKKVDYPPCLPERQGFGSLKYLTKIEKGTIFYKTDIEYLMAIECYGDVFEITDTIYFEATEAVNIFGDYINPFFELKKEAAKHGDKALKEAMKVLLNGLYGKFGSKLLVQSKYFDNDKETHNYETELTPKYLPIAIFITAYAREALLRPIFSNYKAFLYSDTDSIKMNLKKLGFSETEILNHKNEVIKKVQDILKIKIDIEDTGDLGYWTCDHYNVCFLGMKAKSYMIMDEVKNHEVKTAGFHFDKETAALMTTIDLLNGVVIKQLQKTSGEKGKVLHLQPKETKSLKAIWPNADIELAYQLAEQFDLKRTLVFNG